MTKPLVLSNKNDQKNTKIITDLDNNYLSTIKIIPKISIVSSLLLFTENKGNK